jgi:pyruvate dehydrogenase E1 component alpha subunit
MKSAVFNGMDVFTVYENMKKIAEEVREDSMPWFVEIRTYRYRGHSMSDPQKYRTKEELQEYQKIDPDRANENLYSRQEDCQEERDLEEIEQN